MRAYSTMSEMEEFIKKGKDDFINIIGKKSLASGKFSEKLFESKRKVLNSQQVKLGTKRGKEIIDEYQAYMSINILISSTHFENIPINKDTIEFMYDNYDKEIALLCFDPMGYDVYMEQKYGTKSSASIMGKSTSKTENEHAESQPKSEKPFNGNYIELE